ncbi:MAG TPA: asparagine synthase-related protein [Bryobacteraceae bacterium]|nr:asparagine synthase-related protein [Bryobacteraceae bacterium]
MPVSGTSPGNTAFLSAALKSQRRCLAATSDCLWQDEWIALAGSDDLATCIHQNLVLFLDGRLVRQRELSVRPETADSSPLRDVLDAYRRWGDEFPRYLHGDFALALWDAGNRRLVLARDAGGYRPLHYWVRGDQFRFASEARGILAHGDIPLAANQRRIAQWLSGIPEMSGGTFFQGISSVPSGHTVVWECGRVTVRDFWQPSSIPRLRLHDPREYAEGLRSVLDEAVRDRIQGFSSVGSHLSGGLDSSSVTATAARILQERGGRVSAFTAVPAIAVDETKFPGRYCDESAPAAATAAMYPNIEHVLVPNISGSLFHTLDRMSSASESPQFHGGNSCWINAICASAASRGLRAMLTGARGNSTISWDGRGGIWTLIASGRIPEALRLACAMRRNGNAPFASVKSEVWPLLPSSLRRAVDRIRGIDVFRAESGSRCDFAMSVDLDARQALDSIDSLAGRSLRIWCMRRGDLGGHIAGLHRLTGVQQMDPTGDRRVMEYCLSVSEEHYCAKGRRRSLIKDAMCGILPPQVLEERRRGRQSADILFHLTKEKAEIEAELRRLKKIDLAVRCLNLPMLESLVQAWPSPPYGSPEHVKFGNRLMRAISMGRFIRRLEEGTIFSDRFSAAA